jgi:hypothetical protein
MDDLQITILCESYEEMEEGEIIWIKPDEEKLCLFDIDTGSNLSTQPS